MKRARTEREVSNARAQAYLVGYILILGMVVVGSVGVVYFGSTAMTQLRGAANSQNAENALREADTRLSQVAYDSNDAHTLDFSALSGQTTVTHDGSMTITVRKGEHNASRTVNFGTIVVQSKDGDRLAYQAGGIWRETGNGGTMLSPPDVHYQNGTISLQFVNVSGAVEGPVQKLRANKNTTRSRKETLALRNAFNNEEVNPPDNITLAVHSQYYRAWGRFFREYFDDGTVTVDKNDHSATIVIDIAGTSAKVNQDGNSISSSKNVTVTTQVLGTELSSRYSSDGQYYKRNGPITFRVLVNDTARTPWYDDSLTDPIDPQQDNLNDPTKSGPFAYTFQRSGGVKVSVEATSYQCYQYEHTGVQNTYHGTEYVEDRCTNIGPKMIQISSDSNSGNIKILRDGDKVPGYTQAGPEQRSLTEILGSKINDSGYLQLKKNEFVALYELSKADAKWSNAGGEGDPDYNDAVVLITVTESGHVGVPKNFAIHISMNEVVVTKE